MKVFNLAEELEKERKKNKELESKLKATNKILNDMDDIAGEYENRIDKVIEYIENNLQQYKDNLPIIAIDYETLLDILKGSDNNE